MRKMKGVNKICIIILPYLKYIYWWSSFKHGLYPIGSLGLKLAFKILLLSHFSRVRLCVTPQRAAHQAPQSLRFSKQEHWSGLPFPSPMYESEKWKWRRSVVSDFWRPHGLQPTRLLRQWNFPARVLEWGAIAFAT